MASISETGHAVNISNFKLMIDKCTVFGLPYNPSNTDLIIANMTTVWTTGDIAHQTLTTAVVLYFRCNRFKTQSKQEKSSSNIEKSSCDIEKSFSGNEDSSCKAEKILAILKKVFVIYLKVPACRQARRNSSVGVKNS